MKYLPAKIREQYRSKINNYISVYREAVFEDDDGFTHEYDVLEDAYDDWLYYSILDGDPNKLLWFDEIYAKPVITKK